MSRARFLSGLGRLASLLVWAAAVTLHAGETTRQDFQIAEGP